MPVACPSNIEGAGEEGLSDNPKRGKRGKTKKTLSCARVFGVYFA